MTPRERWQRTVIAELERYIAHQDERDVWTPGRLMSAAVGAVRDMVGGRFSTHDALKFAALLVQLVREIQLEDSPDGPPPDS